MLRDLLAVEFDGSTGRAGGGEMGAQARRCCAIRQRPNDQAIPRGTWTMFTSGKGVHSAQQRAEIGFHRDPTLANAFQRGGTAKIECEFVLAGGRRCRFSRRRNRNPSGW